MSKTVLASLVGLIFLFITGCGTMKKALTPEGSLFGAGRVNIASANQMIYEEFEGFTDEELVYLIDPDTKASNLSTLPSAEKSLWLNKAFMEANKNENRRFQIQDRLIAASDQRCNVYETQLKKISSTINGFFGITTTALAGAGAIVTGAEAARILAGLAGISSGSRAELNQALFETVTTSVIIPGIQNRRKEILDEIEKNRENKNYTVERALADAIVYHGACSLNAGIAYAQKSIAQFDKVDLDKALVIKQKIDTANNPNIQDSSSRANQSVPVNDSISLTKSKNFEDIGNYLKSADGSFEPSKVEKVKKECWPKASVPSDTILLDFLLQPAYEPHRLLVLRCINNF